MAFRLVCSRLVEGRSLAECGTQLAFAGLDGTVIRGCLGLRRALACREVVAVMRAARLHPSHAARHGAARHHQIPLPRYRVTNWPAYEAGLKRRGDLTLRLDEAAVACWLAPKRSTLGPSTPTWRSNR